MSGQARPHRVLKFGGTSVTGPERVEVIAAEVRARMAELHPVVVVSAFAKVTDAMTEAARAASSGGGYEPLEERLRAEHLGAARALLGAESEVEVELTRRLDQLGRLLRGAALLGECSPRTLDAVLATGEALSSAVIAAALRARGVPALAVDPGEWIVTDHTFGEAAVDLAATEAAVRREAAAAVAAGQVPIVAGFTGATPGGEVTTLGRGGSDTTGAILGVCLPADLVEIWTDVDGVMSADPRVVPEAASLEGMSFAELLELSHWGAKVVHPGAARLLRDRGVPLVIKNAFHPEHPGTVVSAEGGSSGEVPVRALASCTDAAVLQLTARAGDDATGMTARALAALHRRRVCVILVTQGGSEAFRLPRSARRLSGGVPHHARGGVPARARNWAGRGSARRAGLRGGLGRRRRHAPPARRIRPRIRCARQSRDQRARDRAGRFRAEHLGRGVHERRSRRCARDPRRVLRAAPARGRAVRGRGRTGRLGLPRPARHARRGAPAARERDRLEPPRGAEPAAESIRATGGRRSRTGASRPRR